MSSDVYAYRGARALVLLHEKELRAFLACWQHFVASGCSLPETEDPDYRDPHFLLTHVLGAAGSYLRWCCEKLGEALPAMPTLPDTHRPEQVQHYVDQLLLAWRQPLHTIEERHFDEPAHISRWGVPYTIDAMLEHAVMHPIRHRFQLEELLAARPD